MRKTIFFIFLCAWLSAQEYCGTPDISPTEHLEMIKLIEQAKKDKRNTNKSGAKRYVAIKPQVYRKSDGTGGATSSQLNKGLGMVNAYFKDINIEFYFSETLPNYIDDDRFMNGTYVSSNETTNQTTYGVSNAINVFIVGKTNNGFSGYSFVKPSSQSNNKMTIEIGYLTDNKIFPHEMGHYFGLAHTFNGSTTADVTKRELVTRLDVETGTRLAANCTSYGDYLCDTPSDPRNRTDGTSSPSNCIYSGTVVDANGDLFNPLVNNIMDYNWCPKYQFTPQQLSRMNDAYTYFIRSGAPFNFSAPVVEQPIPTNIEVTSASSNSNVGVTVSWSEASTVESGFFIERSTSPDGTFEVVGGVGSDEVVFTDYSTEAGQTYYYRVKPSNNPYIYSSISEAVTVPQLCDVNIIKRCNSPRVNINSFVLKKGSTTLISNTASGCSQNAYGDYYNTHSATLNAGEVYNFSVSSSYVNGFTPQFYSFFIDYNGDGDFNDTDELVYQFTTKNTTSTTRTGSFTVPSTVESKEVIMRVITTPEKIIDNACLEIVEGEYEDYKIILVGQTLGTTDALKVGDFQVYPNPNTGEKIYLSGDNARNVQEVKLYSTDGKQISVTFKKNDGKVEVTPTTKVERGLYIISIKTDKETLSKKLIVK